MDSTGLELLKILGAFAGAVIGALGAVSYKEYRDQKRLKNQEQQIRWLPLLRSAENLKGELDRFIGIYEHPDNQWNGYSNNGRPLPLAARDIHELYLLDSNTGPIEWFEDVKTDPCERRKDAEAVRRVRARIHELNGVTVLLYRTATYLGYAQRVRTELLHGQLEVSDETRKQITALLANVRRELNGPSGAGMIDDLQDLIGDSVWREDGTVISYHEFRERILSPVEWEKYTELFRFFVHFHKKLHNEVKKTRDALSDLCEELGKEMVPATHREALKRYPVVILARRLWAKRQLASKSRAMP